MFVLRKALELSAGKVDPSTPMTPETALGPQAAEVLSELYTWVVDELVAEQAADAREASELTPSADSLRDDRVADLAELVTTAAVRLLIGSRLDIHPAELRRAHNFALDLGADSLTRVDLVLLLEETLEVSIPDDSMFLVQSVGDAELFAILFDRTREEVVIALEEPARGLTFDTPLVDFGDHAPEIARRAAARSLGDGMSLPECQCLTLKDAVRLAFLTEKLRRAVAGLVEVEPREIKSDTVPGRDLGLSPEKMQGAIDDMTRTMELGASPTIVEPHLKPISDIVHFFAQLPDQVGGNRR